MVRTPWSRSHWGQPCSLGISQTSTRPTDGPSFQEGTEQRRKVKPDLCVPCTPHVPLLAAAVQHLPSGKSTTSEGRASWGQNLGDVGLLVPRGGEGQGAVGIQGYQPGYFPQSPGTWDTRGRGPGDSQQQKGRSAGLLQARKCQWMGQGSRKGCGTSKGQGDQNQTQQCNKASPATGWVLGMSSLPRAEPTEKGTVHPCRGAQH